MAPRRRSARGSCWRRGSPRGRRWYHRRASRFKPPLGDLARRVFRECAPADSGAAIVLPKRLLIANRGEITIRIARTAADLGIPTVGVFSTDDATSLHVRRVDEAHVLAAAGPAAYLDMGAILAVAAAAGCDAIHPGYGFLAENAGFAARCASAGIQFVGPRADVLALFGDKARARALVAGCGLPVVPGTAALASPDEVRAFLTALGPG